MGRAACPKLAFVGLDACDPTHNQVHSQVEGPQRETANRQQEPRAQSGPNPDPKQHPARTQSAPNPHPTRCPGRAWCAGANLDESCGLLQQILKKMLAILLKNINFKEKA